MTTTYTYNSLNLPESEHIQLHSDNKSWTLDYQYNGMGHLRKLVYPDGYGVDYLPNAAGLKEGETTKDGFSAGDLNSMAASLDKGLAAINDNGSGGYFANAESMQGYTTGLGEIGGKKITMNTSHPNFGNNQSTQFTIGHESLHNAGLTHPKYMGFVPYKFGSFGQKMSFKRLPKHKQVTNPDHVMSKVFP